MVLDCADCKRPAKLEEDYYQAFEGDGTEIWLCEKCLSQQDEALELIGDQNDV